MTSAARWPPFVIQVPQTGDQALVRSPPNTPPTTSWRSPPAHTRVSCEGGIKRPTTCHARTPIKRPAAVTTRQAGTGTEHPVWNVTAADAVRRGVPNDGSACRPPGAPPSPVTRWRTTAIAVGTEGEPWRGQDATSPATGGRGPGRSWLFVRARAAYGRGLQKAVKPRM